MLPHEPPLEFSKQRWGSAWSARGHTARPFAADGDARRWQWLRSGWQRVGGKRLDDNLAIWEWRCTACRFRQLITGGWAAHDRGCSRPGLLTTGAAHDRASRTGWGPGHAHLCAGCAASLLCAPCSGMDPQHAVCEWPGGILHGAARHPRDCTPLHDDGLALSAAEAASRDQQRARGSSPPRRKMSSCNGSQQSGPRDATDVSRCTCALRWPWHHCGR